MLSFFVKRLHIFIMHLKSHDVTVWRNIFEKPREHLESAFLCDCLSAVRIILFHYSFTKCCPEHHDTFKSANVDFLTKLWLFDMQMHRQKSV